MTKSNLRANGEQILLSATSAVIPKMKIRSWRWRNHVTATTTETTRTSAATSTTTRWNEESDDYQGGPECDAAEDNSVLWPDDYNDELTSSSLLEDRVVWTIYGHWIDEKSNDWRDCIWKKYSRRHANAHWSKGRTSGHQHVAYVIGFLSNRSSLLALVLSADTTLPLACSEFCPDEVVDWQYIHGSMIIRYEFQLFPPPSISIQMIHRSSSSAMVPTWATH